MTGNPDAIRVLVVDDNPDIHDDIRKTLQKKASARSLNAAATALFGGEDKPEDDAPDYAIDSAYQGEEAYEMVLRAVAEGRPYRIAFTDVRMPPGWDGVETAEKMFQADPDLQAVICTAYSDYSVGEMLKRFGRTDRLLILKKPFDIAEVTLLAAALSEKWSLTRQARATIENQGEHILDLESVLKIVQESQSMLQNKTSTLEEESSKLSFELQRRTAEVFSTCEHAALAMAQLAESRDPETGEHLMRMQETAQLIAQVLAERPPYGDRIDDRFLSDLYNSTPLHDIGKVGIPDAVLLKPGRLTPAEFEVMKRHTLIGARALEGIVEASSGTTFVSMAVEIAMHHHERWDGAGYPLGIKGESIPLAARIASVADVFDALTSDRVYKDAMPCLEARDVIEEGAGSQFDPEVVKAFLECFEECCEIRSRIDDAAQLSEAPC